MTRGPIHFFFLVALLTSCASLNPRDHAVVHSSLLPEGEGMFRNRLGAVPDLLRQPDRSHLVGFEVVSPAEVILSYAQDSDIDRETAQVTRVRSTYRLDPRTGTLVAIDGDAPESRYRDFTDRTPEEQTWFDGALVISPEEYGRRYTFLLEGPDGTPPLPVMLRARYGRGPEELVLSVMPPQGGQRRDWRIRLVTLDMERGVTPALVRQLSAMRWDGERHVTFLDSIFDVHSGERHRLVENVYSSFVELVAVDPRWQYAAIVFGEQRVAREVLTTPLDISALHSFFVNAQGPR